MLDEILNKFKEKKFMFISALISVLLILTVLSFYIFSHRSQQKDSDSFSAYQTILNSSGSKQTALSGKDSQKQADKAEITIDIKGAVQKEGVYTLPAGSRVTDAVKRAGGLTAEADRKSVNLAQKIEDEAVIYIAEKGENISVIPPSSASGTDSTESGAGEKINLNTATLAELQTLSGIGVKRAQDILDYRDSKGGFSSVDELAEISGIGEKTLAKLKEEVTVD